MRGFTDENKFSGSLLRRDRNFRLAIPSLIVNNHRPGFSSAQLLVRHGSHSNKRASPEFPRASNLSPRRKSPSSREIVINAAEPRSARQELARVNKLSARQLSRNMLALTFLELTTSDSDGKTPFVGEIVSHRKVLTGSHSNQNN